MLFAASVLGAAAPAPAREATRGDISLARPQIRASIGNAPNTAAYVAIRNRGSRPDQLVSASCTCAARVEIHTQQTQDGVARMVRVPAVTVPASGEAVLAPGGAHLMLFGLKRPVRDGEDQTLTLVFQRAGAVTTRFRATARVEASAGDQGGHVH